MMNLFFPSTARVTRKHYWFASVGYVVVAVIVALIYKILGIFIPNESTEPGSFSVTGVNAIPYIVVGFGSFMFGIVSNVKVMRRRFHDRDKSGWWILIMVVPLIGQLWALIELGFLAGTPGPNRYGPPVGSNLGSSADMGYSTAV